jgi:hypothetical protein
MEQYEKKNHIKYQIHSKYCRTHVCGSKWYTKWIHLLVGDSQCFNSITKNLPKIALEGDL